MALLSVVAGLILLLIAGDRLVTAAVALSANLRIPRAVVGATIVAAGTSMPELVVSLAAAFQGSPDIALGNVVGSNLYNLGLILGMAALIHPLSVSEITVRRELPVLVGVTLLLWALCSDGTLGLFDGLLLLAGQAAVLAWMAYRSRAETAEPLDEAMRLGLPRSVLELAMAFAALSIGGKLLVDGGVQLASMFGVGERVIGLTVVAIGTSLPELAASTAAAWRGESDIAIGNVVGSNLFNILLILGVTASVHPLAVNPAMLAADIPVLVAFTVGAWFLATTGRTLTRGEGGVLLTSAGGYTLWLL